MDPVVILFPVAATAGIIAISYALDRVWAAALPGRYLYLLLRAPGIVLHECAHIAGCMVTGARVQRVVLLSREGGSVAHSRPAVPLIGNVVISTAPLLVLPFILSLITVAFSVWFGCVFPDGTVPDHAPGVLSLLPVRIAGSLMANVAPRFNPWFLLYLYLAISIVLATAPSLQDMKNAVAGIVLLALAAFLVLESGVKAGVSLVDLLLQFLNTGLVSGLLFGIIALIVSLPLIVWYACARFF